MDDEARRVVRAGYEQVAAAYDARRPRDGADVAWLDDVIAAVGRGGRVLDAGCGAGEPVATRLLAAGLAVVGVDCAAAPLRLARRLA
ncbi:MAG TPA: SAM-dependent methyltransferase, partial [Acidimicrobiia bacterium]|nr:SAM-dependent methyltransferase [Acidimicrobiia bacterium]